MATNVVGVAGAVPHERAIKEMTRGEVGYTVPWAYDRDRSELDETFTIGPKGGTASLRVECVRPGKYSLTFEEPVYRTIGGAP